MGAPSSVWKNLDGSEVWEYPQGPLGTQTYMVSFGPEHVVRDIRPVLNEGTFSKLRAGMSREEVRRLLGRPAGASFSDRTDEEIWYWRYLEWGVRKMELYAQFDRPTGALKRITRVQIDASGGKPR